MHRNKAVSDGAISFYLDHYVRTRVAKVTYGAIVHEVYNPLDREHGRRAYTVYTDDTDGSLRIPGCFRAILPKVGSHNLLRRWCMTPTCHVSQNTQVSETTEFKTMVFQTSDNATGFKAISSEIICYRGQTKNPSWMDVDASKSIYRHVIEFILSNSLLNMAFR